MIDFDGFTIQAVKDEHAYQMVGEAAALGISRKKNLK